LRTNSYLAVFAITLSATILALALGMSVIYVIQTPPIFWNNVTFSFLMIALIALPTALFVCKISYDMFFLKRKLSHVIRYDHLTGTLRKETFLKDLRKAKLMDGGMALMLDVDNLSTIVSEFGYDATDHILKAVADEMTNIVRDKDKVCRLGFERFMVILNSVDLEEGIIVARRIQETIAKQPVESGEHLIPVSVSIGAVSMEEDCEIDNVLERANLELTQAKASGSNRLSFNANSDFAKSTETDLRQDRTIN